MKWLVKIAPVAVAAFLLTGCSASKNAAAQPPDGTITYQEFYDDLSPYGTWIDFAPYGEVWSPNLAVGFRPYATNGYWLYTNLGWAWNSGYSWGWAPFHYGRWIYDDFYGWLWVPGYEWSPAWVTWGFYGDFYCWAPLMPGVNVGFAYRGYMPHSIYWNVVPRGHIYDRDLGRVLIHRDAIKSNDITIINNFNRTSIHNQFYARGPEVSDVEKYTNTHIAPVRIHDVNKVNEVTRGESNIARPEGGVYNVYRPVIRHSQPHEYRIIENQNSNRPMEVTPNREAERGSILGPREEQRENVRSLPVFRAPERTLPRESGGRPVAPVRR